MRVRAVVATAAILAMSVAATNAAFAACTRLSFSVNDYGKDGPTKDARNLLDSYATKWTSERGIKKFSVGPKEVSCELFLNFIVFDEHTCTATANVCWEGSVPAPVKEASGATPFVNKAATAGAQPKARAAVPATAAPAAAAGSATGGVTTGSVKPAPAAPVAARAPAVAAPAQVAPIAAPTAPAASVMPAAPAAVPAAPQVAPAAAAPAPAASGN